MTAHDAGRQHVQTYRFSVFAEYHQIYLEDHEMRMEDNDNPFEGGDQVQMWVSKLLTSEAFTRHIGIMPGALCILTARYSEVPVEVHIQATAPDDDLTGWDHVAETTLALPSGILVVRGCTDGPAQSRTIHLSPASYNARVYVGGLEKLKPDPFDRGEGDLYRVVLWPWPIHSPGTVVVLRAADPTLWQ